LTAHGFATGDRVEIAGSDLPAYNVTGKITDFDTDEKRFRYWRDDGLELLTTDLDELKIIWDWVGFGKWDQHLERNQQMVRTPVNARTNQQSVVSRNDSTSTRSSLP
jgi:hypothetical protein